MATQVRPFDNTEDILDTRDGMARVEYRADADDVDTESEDQKEREPGPEGLKYKCIVHDMRRERPRHGKSKNELIAAAQRDIPERQEQRTIRHKANDAAVH